MGIMQCIKLCKKLKGNGAAIEKEIIAEDLYYSDLTSDDQPVKNKYPYHYFMSEVENGVSQTSKLDIEGLANEKRIYIRDLFLFKDYIPVEYGEAFKNIDLSLIETDKMLQSMVFVCNFADFNLDKMTLTYYVINQQNTESGQITSSFTKTKKTVKLYRSSKISSSKTFELCSNFGFIKVIAPVSIDLCRNPTTEANDYTIIKYCNEDKKPIVCAERYYIIISEGITKCSDICPSNIIRVPGSPFFSGICNIEAISGISSSNIPTGYTHIYNYNQGNI